LGTSGLLNGRLLASFSFCKVDNERVVLDVALVGTGGMMPLPNRWLSSVLIRFARHLILFDCGEGTQISLRALGWGLKDIDLVLISHLHGDHIAGLPGLLLTQGNSGRTEPLDVLGPPGLTQAVEGLRVVAPYLPFEVRCRELDPGDVFELDELQGRCGAGDHHVPCLAYRLDVPRGREFSPERARQLGLPIEFWKALQREQEVRFDRRMVQPDEVLGPPRRGLSLALITDTRPTTQLTELARGVDLMVCEGTYGDDADQPRAVERKHMTFSEAALLAKHAGAEELLLTHFSPALVDPMSYAHNAQTIFHNAIVGQDHYARKLTFN
jgi:ribonuclease Z